jgi:HSP20 family protein
METKDMAETVPIKKTKSLFEELSSLNERIMRRAHDIFSQSGIFGKELDNWLQAERELVWKPSIELEEKDSEFRIQIAVPGVDPKDLDIEVTSEDILVKAELTEEHKEKKGKVHITEFASGNLFRAIHLPKRIDPDKVKAEFKNGLLTLKAEIAQEARAKKIHVGAA